MIPSLDVPITTPETYPLLPAAALVPDDVPPEDAPVSVVLPEDVPVSEEPVLLPCPEESVPDEADPDGAASLSNAFEMYPVPEPVDTTYQLSVSPMTVTAVPRPSVEFTSEPVLGCDLTLTPSAVYIVTADP